MFREMNVEGFQRVLLHTDDASGLHAIIAIHNTTLGPALGGVRFRAYHDQQEAIDDCLLLAQAMTLKASVAGLDLGGGWSVILGDPTQRKSPHLLRAHGRFIARLSGQFIPVNDIGTTQNDIAEIGRETQPVCAYGDPSPMTALGVVEAIRACMSIAGLGKSLRSIRVAVQGVGNVGASLVELLHDAGAQLIVSDVDEMKAKNIASKYGIDWLPPNRIVLTACDVLAPCATGNVIRTSNVSNLQCRVIAGGANNVLEHASLESALMARGIVYAPDFCANAGGLIFLSEHMLGHTNQQTIERVRTVGDTVMTVLQMSQTLNTTATEAANELAMRRLRKHSAGAGY
ncbi:MAG: Glu/Leu/Phe/Val dehydrogenase [Caldilineaceae bacterium]|nr:Glu/Leu/Phe/Val dehydrogenase [Caldilineaceae bacterium]